MGRRHTHTGQALPDATGRSVFEHRGTLWPAQPARHHGRAVTRYLSAAAFGALGECDYVRLGDRLRSDARAVVTDRAAAGVSE